MAWQMNASLSVCPPRLTSERKMSKRLFFKSATLLLQASFEGRTEILKTSLILIQWYHNATHRSRSTRYSRSKPICEAPTCLSSLDVSAHDCATDTSYVSLSKYSWQSNKTRSMDLVFGTAYVWHGLPCVSLCSIHRWLEDVSSLANESL